MAESRRLEDEIVSALRRLGVEAIAATSISGLPGLASDRATFRIATRDGRTVKARRATRPERAARYVRLVRALERLPLSRILGRRGRVVLEEWIEGTPLDRLALTPSRLRAAADLLAAIHATTSLGGRRLARRSRTRSLVTLTEKRIAGLRADGALSKRESERLAGLVRELAPPSAATGLIHNDFCGANLVEDGAGRLHAVDNAGFDVGFLELDLARSRARWPMTAARWRVFLDRYERIHPRAVTAAEARFWRLVALTRSAHFRVSRRSPDVAPALASLRRMLPREGG